MRNIYVLGHTGMLGSMVAKTWEGSRTVSREALDAETPNYDWYKKGDLIINAIGVIKPYCTDVERAIRVNALFPHTLPSDTIQIATDCVYSGSKGKYVESDPHDATDVYGQTKSLGEALHIKHLRCSIIGPELKGHLSLLDQFLAGNIKQGYTNHKWNGITTLAFSKICQGIAREGIELPISQHIVPADVVSKAQLLRIIAKAYKRDIKIEDTEAETVIDRTLDTHNKAMNRKLWKAAGYDNIPTIEELVVEMANL